MAQPQGIESPGSLLDFAETQGLDPSSPDAFARYTQSLGVYTDQLAASLGIRVEDLHSIPNPTTEAGGGAPASATA